MSRGGLEICAVANSCRKDLREILRLITTLKPIDQRPRSQSAIGKHGNNLIPFPARNDFMTYSATGPAMSTSCFNTCSIASNCAP